MREVTFDSPVLKVKGLEARFDVIPVSNSLAILIGSRDLASIVHQLNYWEFKGYGEVIDGVRWFYKSIKEWIEEVFPTFSPWKLSKMMKELVERGIIRRKKLFTKHQIQQGSRFWWQPKNQTYYYSLVKEKIQELADNYSQENVCTEKTPETPENPVSIKTQKLSNHNSPDTKFSDCAKFNTENTSTENSSREVTHPTLPSVGESSEDVIQEKDSLDTSELSKTSEKTKVTLANLEVVEKETSSADVDNKINQNKDTGLNDISVVSEVSAKQTAVSKTDNSRSGGSLQKRARPKPKTVKKPKQKRERKNPWKSEEQFKEFYRALIQALPITDNAPSPHGLAQTIIRQLRCGVPHSYWDDFEAGLPIGWTDKPEWEIEPGEPYPMFVEYLTEKLRAGNNTKSDEQTRNEVFRILDKPRQAKAYWGQFKRSVVNVAETVERDRALGVSNPATPVWTRERVEPSIEEAAVAGEKIMAINNTAPTAITGTTNRVLETTDNHFLENHHENRKHLVSIESSTPDPWTDDRETEERRADEIREKTSNSSSEKPQPSMREMLAERLGDRNLKGFVKEMPKVSQQEAREDWEAEIEAINRQKLNQKTYINRMSVKEINQLLVDPVMRKELTPQIIENNKFEIVTDNLGEVLFVRISEEYRDNGGT